MLEGSSKLLLMVLCQALAGVLLSDATVDSASPERKGWGTKAPLPEANSEMAVAELAGKIYVIGGYPSTRKTVATVQMYDVKTDRWQIVAPLPMALIDCFASHASALQDAPAWRYGWLHSTAFARRKKKVRLRSAVFMRLVFGIFCPASERFVG